MIIGLHGTTPGHEDDPLCIIPPLPFDALVIEGPLTKDQREDLQISSFAAAVSLSADNSRPVDIRPGGDPADRIVNVDSRARSVELTELTIFDVRKELAQSRQLGRALNDRLSSDASRMGHLFGRLVVLAVLPDEPLPRDGRLARPALHPLEARPRVCRRGCGPH